MNKIQVTKTAIEYMAHELRIDDDEAEEVLTHALSMCLYENPNDGAFVNLLKSDASMRIVMAGKIKMTLKWEYANSRWEVYYVDPAGSVLYEYKGDSLNDALQALTGSA